ncbi:MAG: glycosyltransferase family 39 protein [Methanobacterium sp.]|nr:glycosyltransferase family 39 protein [Methanobacterium sp.]
MAFLIVLIPTLKFQWPLSWDIYYHVHLTQLYLANGFTLWDPLTVAPSGRPIAYPPVFHLLLAGLSILFNWDPFQIVRFMQPFLGMALVLVITFVTYRLFGLISGISAGLLTIYSLITFNRGFIVSPATLSFILMPLVLYLYYLANEDLNLRYLIISGILCGVVCLTHSLTALIIIMVILLFAVTMKILKRNISFKFLIIFLLITTVLALLWWGPLYLFYHPQFNVFSGYPLPISEYYIRYLGIIPTILATVGGLLLLKKGENKGIFILVWAFSILLLSRAYFLGLNLIPIRILEVASYPIIIMAGYGLAVILDRLDNGFKKSEKSSVTHPVTDPYLYIKKHFKPMIIILLAVFTMVSGVVFADGYTPNLVSQEDAHPDYIFPQTVHLLFNPMDYIFKFQVIADRYGNLTLAENREGVMEWFKKNGDKNSTVYSVDSYMDTIIVSTSRLHVIKGGYSESIPYYVFKRDMNDLSNLSREEILNANIKYLLLRNGMEIPPYAREVYRNGNYIICIIE